MPISYQFDPTGSRLTTDNDTEMRAFLGGFQNAAPPPTRMNSRGGGRGGVGGFVPYPTRDIGSDLAKHAQAGAAVQEAAARAAKARAIYEPPPMRPMIGGPGMIVGPRSTKLDMAGLTGAQRDVFLPKVAGFTDPAAEQQAEEIRKANAAKDWGSYVNGMERRGMVVNG